MSKPDARLHHDVTVRREHVGRRVEAVVEELLVRVEHRGVARARHVVRRIVDHGVAALAVGVEVAEQLGLPHAHGAQRGVRVGEAAQVAQVRVGRVHVGRSVPSAMLSTIVRPSFESCTFEYVRASRTSSVVCFVRRS
jgi:hypothetical protein